MLFSKRTLTGFDNELPDSFVLVTNLGIESIATLWLLHMAALFVLLGFKQRPSTVTLAIATSLFCFASLAYVFLSAIAPWFLVCHSVM